MTNSTTVESFACAIVDTFTRYAPAVDVRQAYKGADVVDTLERVCKQIGYPKMIRCDNVLHQNAITLCRQKVSSRHLAMAA